MNSNRQWVDTNGVTLDTISGIGRYSLYRTVEGRVAGTLAFRMAGAGSATVKLETLDGTQIGDTMTITTTTPKILTASAAPVEITLAGPRILNVSAITGDLIAEVYA